MEEYTNYLVHHGVKGQKWGVRRYQNADGSLKGNYRPIGIRSAIARRKNRKIDKSFQKWKQGVADRDAAISAGKKANQARISNDKEAYKTLNKEYKKALRKNTTYRKGTVKQEVHSDLSRKYLSEAKRVKKQIDSGNGNKDLQRQYNHLMSRYDVYRAKSRRDQQVAANRSYKKASIKRGMTMTVKAAAATTVIAAGTYFIGKQAGVKINTNKVKKAIKVGKLAMKFV